MKILVPTDFSKTADKALQYAIDSFMDTDATFILYHAFRPFVSGFYSYHQSEEENRRTEIKLKKRLAQKAESFSAANENVKIKTHLDRGPEERAIPKYAKTAKADLIVMGTTGATGLKEKLIGSITASIMSKSSIPVIAVPAKYKVRPLKNIAFCSNFRLEDIRALKHLEIMTRASRPDLQIWHFYKKGRQKVNEEELAGEYRKMINRMYRNKKITFHFSGTENPAMAIEKLSTSRSLDMLVMITRRRKGLINMLLDNSLTKKVAYHTKIPLMAIPAGA